MGETERLRTLHGYGLLDTLPEKEFDEIVKRAAKYFNVPVALLSLVDTDRQWFKAKVGLDVDEMPRSVAFCSYAIEGDAVMVVTDATADVRFADNPLVLNDPSIRFYAGAPIFAEDGSKLGTVCIIDREPRGDFTEVERGVLAGLSGAISRIASAKRKALAIQT